MKVLLFFALLNLCQAFYLPGIAPVNYCTVKTDHCKDEVEIYVNRLDSVKTILPFEYGKFDFCEAPSNKEQMVESLGQVIFGERIHKSPYKLKFAKRDTCVKVCTKKYSKADFPSQKRLEFLKMGIKKNYYHHWILDNMPVAWCYRVEDNGRYCSPGFPIGCHVDANSTPMDACRLDSSFRNASAFYIFNHVSIVITYHSGKSESWGSSIFTGDRLGGRLVSAKVELRSIDHGNEEITSTSCDGNLSPMIIMSAQQDALISYTYSVQFQENNAIKWSSRWDYILDSMSHTNIQWFSIINSLVIVLFLSGMVAVIVVRTLHKDIIRYNQIDLEDAQEEFGWKLVHGDVFRPPRFGMLLSVFVGNGLQVFVMTSITILLACLGFLSPSRRGALMTCGLVLYVLLGTLSGYTSARIYKMFGGEKWKSNLLLTAFLVPGVVLGICFILNILLWIKSSSAALPFTALLAVLSLWLFVSVPLTFVGAFFGFRRRATEHPVRTNQIPRQVPPQSCYTRPLAGILMGGVLPFGCIFIQLFFILNSIWSHQIYYMFGIMLIVFLILVITCSEATILLCYFHLCSENYHWWWRSFLTSGSTAVYFFFYATHFFITKLSVSGFVSTVLYFGYTAIMVFTMFLLCGTIGYFSCFFFVSKIYSVVKID